MRVRRSAQALLSTAHKRRRCRKCPPPLACVRLFADPGTPNTKVANRVLQSTLCWSVNTPPGSGVFNVVPGARF